MKLFTTSVTIIVLVTLSSCGGADSNKRESLTEVDPIKIVIEGENADDVSGWKVQDYYTGTSLSIEDAQVDSNFAEYNLRVSRQGIYYLHAMVANRRFPKEDGNILVILKEDTVEIDVPNSRALLWANPVEIMVDAKDSITLRLQANSGDNTLYLDQMVLTDAAGFSPAGYEYEQEDFTEIALPPAWAFGIIYGGYTNQTESIERVDRLIEEGYPVDAYWVDSWFWDYTNEGAGPDGYIDFVGDTAAFPDMEKMWSYFEEQNVKSGIWVWDAIQDIGNQSVYNDFKSKGYFKSEPGKNGSGWHNEYEDSTLIGDIDFEREEVAAYWKEQMKPFFEKGLDFLKLDKSSDVAYMKTAFEATQDLSGNDKTRGFILSHLHSTSQQSMKKYPAKWTGDAKIAWSQADYPNMGNYSMGALKENIMMVADPRRSTYEVPFLTNDLGGYNYFGSDEQSDSLYIRWAQFSLMNPITTVFSTADSPNSNMPFNFSDQAQEVFRYYADLKISLFPYIYSYAHANRESGKKIIQGDGENPLQFTLGNEILVAPVLQEKQRVIFLPEGEWYNFYSDEKTSGGAEITVETELERVPMYIRSGSIIPRRLSTNSIQAGSNDTLALHIYPAEDDFSFMLFEDDGVSLGYQNGQIARTNFTIETSQNGGLTLLIGAVQGSFDRMKETRTYQVIVHDWRDSKVTNVEGLTFDSDKQILSFYLSSITKMDDFKVEIP